MAQALFEAVHGLRVADPGLGVKPLLAKLQEQQPDLGVDSQEDQLERAAAGSWQIADRYATQRSETRHTL